MFYYVYKNFKFAMIFNVRDRMRDSEYGKGSKTKIKTTKGKTRGDTDYM